VYARARHVIAAEFMSRRTMVFRFGTCIAYLKSKRRPGVSAINNSPNARHVMSLRRKELRTGGKSAPQDTDSDELARLKTAQHCDCRMSSFCWSEVESQKERNGIWVHEV
jgi:hypothetical protein